MIEQLAGRSNTQLSSISGEKNVEGEHISVLGLVKGVMGCRKAAAFGVKEDEMIGEIGGKWYEVFEVKCMKGLASYKVSSTDACLQNLAECLESPRVLVHLRLHNFA